MDIERRVDDTFRTTRDPLVFDGMEPVFVEDGNGDIVLEVDITKEMINPNGFIHGGMTFTLADMCAGIGASSLGFKVSTLQSSVNFLRPGLVGEKLIAKNKVIHHGKTTIVSIVEIYNDKEKLVLAGTFTMAKLGPRERAY